MKRLLVVTLLALAVPGLAFGQAGPRKMTPAASKTAEQEVMALERAWLAAGAISSSFMIDLLRPAGRVDASLPPLKRWAILEHLFSPYTRGCVGGL